MVRAQCDRVAEGVARGWGLYRCDVPGEDELPMLCAFCPDCIEREFIVTRPDQLEAT